jgi:hypothetical protein
MFHVKHATVALLLINFHQIGYSQAHVTIQDKPISIPVQKIEWIQDDLLTDGHYKSLTRLERDFFYWVNHLRFSPSLFAKDIVVKYLEQFPEMESSSSDDLLKELNGIETLPLLVPDSKLSSVAKSHGMDLVKNGRSLSHTGSRGRDFALRIRETGFLKCASENLYEGRAEALEALILLLIDHGVPGYGHRKAILKPYFGRMGCSVVQRPDNVSFVFVQIFSCQ